MVKNYKITSDVDGKTIFEIETNDTIGLVYGDKTSIHIGKSKISFGQDVSIEAEPVVPEDYTETFSIDIGDELYDLVHESLTNRGVDDEVAYNIAGQLSCTYIDVEVEICPEEEDASVCGVSEA